MNDLISRKELMERVLQEEYDNDIYTDGRTKEIYHGEYQRFYKIIAETPAANDYYAIGTVEECRKARERQRAKKVMVVRARNEKESVSPGDYVRYKCPNCEKKIGSAFHYPFNEYIMKHNFCNECGQKLDWSDNNDLNS